MITCPSCKNSFALEEVMTDEIKKELRAEMVAYKSRKDDEVRQLQELLARKDLEISERLLLANRSREEEFQKKLAEISKQALIDQEILEKKLATEKKLMQQGLEENLRKTISADFENQLQILTKSNKDSEEKLRLSRQKELEYPRKEQEKKRKEE